MERGFLVSGPIRTVEQKLLRSQGNLARGCQLSVRDCDGKADGIWEGKRGF